MNIVIGLQKNGRKLHGLMNVILLSITSRSACEYADFHPKPWLPYAQLFGDKSVEAILSWIYGAL